MLCNCFALRFISSFFFVLFPVFIIICLPLVHHSRANTFQTDAKHQKKKSALTLVKHQQNTSGAHYLSLRLNLSYNSPRIINNSYTFLVDSFESQEITATFCTFTNFDETERRDGLFLFPLCSYCLCLFCCVSFIISVLLGWQLFSIVNYLICWVVIFSSVCFRSLDGRVKMFRK